MEQVEIAAGGWTFRGYAAGPEDGRLVLFLHGFPQSSLSWARVVPQVAAAGHRCVAFDQRGYSPGARPVGVEHYGPDALAGDVAAAIAALGRHRADLVGHDWGAAVAWQVAGRHPALVRSLVAVSVPHPMALSDALRTDPDQRERSAYIRVFRRAGEAEERLRRDDWAPLRRMYGSDVPGQDVARHLAVLAEPGALTAALSYYRAMDASFGAGLAPVTAPVTYVWGEDEVAIGPQAAHACGAHVSGPYTFVPLTGAGHWVPEQVPDRLAGIVLDHLARS